MIISISGAAGSGKSTVAKMLAEKLGWPRYYIGGLRRQKAKEKGMTLSEYNKLGEKDPSTDLEVDEYQRELGRNEDNFIIEGRTSWYFIPHSFKVYFEVDEKEGARRILKDLRSGRGRNEGKGLETLDAVLDNVRRRRQSDIKRYEKYYGIDVYDEKNYDYVLDTTNLSPQETFDALWREIKDLVAKKDGGQN